MRAANIKQVASPAAGFKIRLPDFQFLGPHWYPFGALDALEPSWDPLGPQVGLLAHSRSVVAEDVAAREAGVTLAIACGRR